MAKSISVKPKRGRPATGRDPLVGVRFPVSAIYEIDGYAEGSGVSRSEAIRRLVELGLKAKGK